MASYPGNNEQVSMMIDPVADSAEAALYKKRGNKYS
jgi:hypothetical protein